MSSIDFTKCEPSSTRLEEGACERCGGDGYDPEDSYLEPPHFAPMPEACRHCRGCGKNDCDCLGDLK